MKKLSAYERRVRWVGKFLQKRIRTDADTNLTSIKIWRDLNKPKETK